jgi:hypothetical protein
VAHQPVHRREPTFLFVPTDQVMAVAERERAIPYDVPNVELGHHGDVLVRRVLDKYQLTDPALPALATIVRGADTDARQLTPESAGLYALRDRLPGHRQGRPRQHGEAVSRVRRALRLLPRQRARDARSGGHGRAMDSRCWSFSVTSTFLRIAASGGFDHAAVHGRRGLLYVAHTANDAVDVIDCAANRYLRSIPGLGAVAGALVSEADDLVFTSNRGENTVGIFSAAREGT